MADLDAATRTKLLAGRLVAIDLQPFLATGLFALQPVAAPGLGTFGVDARWRLSVDPAVVEAWSVAEIAGVLLHEVGHVVRDHAGRAQAMFVGEDDATRWNIAADAEINDDLLADGVRLPGRPVTPGRLKLPRHRVAEYYFEQLWDIPRDRLPDVPGCGPGCTGHGAPVPVAEDAPPGLDDAEALAVRRQIAIAIRDRHHAVGRGTGGWRRWAEALLGGALDWRVLLRATMRSGLVDVPGTVDYSYRRPSRRPPTGVVMPSLVRRLPLVAAIVDTSASVSDHQLSVAWTEITACLEALGARRDLLRVYAADVHAHLVATGGRRIALPGGGGTAMDQAIETVLQRRPRPHVVVVLTDGFTPWPQRPPPARVVVALLGDDGPLPPPWARTVRIPAEER